MAIQNNKLLPAITLAVISLLLPGCTNEKLDGIGNILKRPTHIQTGKIISAQPVVGLSIKLYIPKVVVQDENGKTTSIGKMGYPFYVLVFIKLPGKDPSYIHPDVIKLANALSLDDIDVVQITIPGPECDLKNIDLSSIAPPKQKNLLRFFDTEKLAWAGWHYPPNKTVKIVNAMPIFPVISKQTTLEHYDSIIDAAEKLQQEWNDFQAESDNDTAEI